MTQNNLDNNKKLCIYLYDRIDISLSSIFTYKDNNNRIIFDRLDKITNNSNNLEKKKNEIKKKYDQDNKKIKKEINEINKKKTKSLSELEKLEKHQKIAIQKAIDLNQRKKLPSLIDETDLKNKIASDQSIKRIKLELEKLNEECQINSDEIERRNHLMQKVHREITDNNNNLKFLEKIKYDIAECEKDLINFNLSAFKSYKNLTDINKKFAEQIYDKIQPAKKDILLKNRESIKPYKLDEEDILLQKTIKDLSKLFYPYGSQISCEPFKNREKTNSHYKPDLIIHYDPKEIENDNQKECEPQQIFLDLKDDLVDKISNIINSSILLNDQKNRNASGLNAFNKKNNELRELIISIENKLQNIENDLRKMFFSQEREKIDTDLREIENYILVINEKIINNSNEIKFCDQNVENFNSSLNEIQKKYEKEINTLEETKLTPENLINEMIDISKLFISTISNDLLSKAFYYTESKNYNALYYTASFNPSTYYILIFDLIPLKKEDTMHLTEENIKCMKFMQNILNKEKEAEFDIGKFFEQFIIPAYENILSGLENQTKIEKPNNIEFFNINNFNLSAKLLQIISYQENREEIKNKKELQKIFRVKDQILKDIISGKKNIIYDIYKIDNQMDALQERIIEVNKHISSYALTDEDFLKFLQNTCTLELTKEDVSTLKPREDFQTIMKESKQRQKISECFDLKKKLNDLDVKERLKIITNGTYFLSILDNLNILLSIICIEEHVFISTLNIFFDKIGAQKYIFDNEFLMLNEDKFNKIWINLANNSSFDIIKLSKFYKSISKLPSFSTINKLYTKNSIKIKKILILCVSYFLKNYKKFLEFHIQLEVILDHGLIFMSDEKQFNIVLFDKLNEKFSEYLDLKIGLYIQDLQSERILESNTSSGKKKLNKSKDTNEENKNKDHMEDFYYKYIEKMHKFFAVDNNEFIIPKANNIQVNDSDQKILSECSESKNLLILDEVFNNLTMTHDH